MNFLPYPHNGYYQEEWRTRDRYAQVDQRVEKNPSRSSGPSQQTRSLRTSLPTAAELQTQDTSCLDPHDQPCDRGTDAAHKRATVAGKPGSVTVANGDGQSPQKLG
jgi:hypothetical protein